jgi:hypothetical protein
MLPLTGLILRVDIWNRPKQEHLFEDLDWWEVPDGYPPEPRTEKDSQGNIQVIANDYTHDAELTKV